MGNFWKKEIIAFKKYLRDSHEQEKAILLTVSWLIGLCVCGIIIPIIVLVEFESTLGFLSWIVLFLLLFVPEYVDNNESDDVVEVEK